MAPDLRAQLQSTLGDAYSLERELGGGGMSCVFVADEIALGREVVVKVVAPERVGGVSVARFTREAKYNRSERYESLRRDPRGKAALESVEGW